MIQDIMKNKKQHNFDNSNNIPNSNNMFGFWIYLMSDGILFATMFAVYCVMSINIPLNMNIFNLKIVFLETLILLLSSIFCGVLVVSAKYKKLFLMYFFISLTFLCGFFFVVVEAYEFFHLIQLGYTPQKDGFLSSFFSLIGMHGIHVIFGLLWILGLLFHIHKVHSKTIIYNRILCFSLFWHFLDIIWICIFTVVYLLGNL